MEPRIKERFNDHILQQAAQRYDIQPGHIRLLDGFESFMYEFDRPDGEYVLRIGHSLRRSENLIQSEVDWLNHLAAGGASVARAIRSTNGALVEQIDDDQGEKFLVTAFVRAKGMPPRGPNWNAALFTRYGQALGRMHALSQKYTPGSPACVRPQWDDEGMLDVERFLPATDERILAHYHELMAHLACLPRRPQEYGLIHQDAHGGNFFVDEQGTLTFFDFDDCAYSWYINDIAVVLFYAVMYPKDAGDIRNFIVPFLKGYWRENRFEPWWLGEIPAFLKLREIDMYAMIHRSFDLEALDDPWVARFMAGRKERLETGQPYHDFDFTRLADELE